MRSKDDSGKQNPLDSYRANLMLVYSEGILPTSQLTMHDIETC